MRLREQCCILSVEFVEPHRLLPPVDVDREVFVELVSLLHLAAVGLGLAPQRLLVVGRSAAVRLSAALRGPQLRIAVSFLRSIHRLKEIILLGVRRPGAALQLLGMAAHLGLGQRIGEFGPPALPLLAQRLRLLVRSGAFACHLLRVERQAQPHLEPTTVAYPCTGCWP